MDKCDTFAIVYPFILKIILNMLYKTWYLRGLRNKSYVSPKKIIKSQFLYRTNEELCDTKDHKFIAMHVSISHKDIYYFELPLVCEFVSF